DGRTYRQDQLKEAAGILASRDGFLIVDEAFGDVMPELSIVPNLPVNTIVLRSFGKFFGLAGLRLGFSICAREIADQMVKAFGPWSVSGPALAIGLQALSDQTWILGMRTKVEKQSLKQADQISSCGLNLVANTCLFMEFEAEDGIELSQSLMSEHILVRSFPDRPNRLRFGLCKDDFELDKLASALKKHV
ncbi:MAG: aminotransferase class I/II-fold pyridoxal phosphate-dependent enzyme, partial [Pseudomonadota bacterium]